VGIQGVDRELVMSEVPEECPGLIGPDQLSAWEMKLDFRDKTFESAAGIVSPITFARSGHPCMSLLEYDHEEPKEVYQAQALIDPEDGGSSGLAELLNRTSSRVEYYNLAEEDTDKEDVESTSSESSHVWTTEQELTEEDTTEEETVGEVGVFATHQAETEKVKFMSKGNWRHVRAAVKNIQEEMSGEGKSKKVTVYPEMQIEKCLDARVTGPRRSGPWRFLEIFTWTCAVTMAAQRRGWDTYEPITLPTWDLQLMDGRTCARKYIMEVDPDFVVLAPPCGPWSTIQLINQRTPMQVRELHRKRQAARDLLLFVEEVVRYQHIRGRVVVVENPKTSLIWDQAAAEECIEQTRYG
jgi:hypothetical protein